MCNMRYTSADCALNLLSVPLLNLCCKRPRRARAEFRFSRDAIPSGGRLLRARAELEAGDSIARMRRHLSTAGIFGREGGEIRRMRGGQVRPGPQPLT